MTEFALVDTDSLGAERWHRRNTAMRLQSHRDIKSYDFR